MFGGDGVLTPYKCFYELIANDLKQVECELVLLIKAKGTIHLF